MKEIKPQEAYDLMQKDPEYIYLDVRSVLEFEQGHASGAKNIPLLHFVPGMGMTPNSDFSKVVEANFPKDAKLLVGCKMGGRSFQACEILTSMGYNNVANIAGGFSGAMDPMGRITDPGWSTLNLPLCADCQDDSRYESMAAKAK